MHLFILIGDERSMVRAICEVQLKDIKGVEDLLLMLGYDYIIDQLVMANSLC